MNFRILSSIFPRRIINKIERVLNARENPIIFVCDEHKKSYSGALLAVTYMKDMESALTCVDTLKNEYNFLFYMIADAIDSREGIPTGSARRMVKIAELLGKQLHLSSSQLWVLEHACVLRDIGKVKVSNDILLKKTVLSYEEWMMLKSHAQLGADMLKEFGVFPELVEVIASHHESYDGDGYPLGLEGDEIPFLSRVLKVIDVYCAITSPRMYRMGFATREEALIHLQEERGKHFDPEVVDAFLEIDVESIDIQY
ncbi:MAG TPA: HD domain-containing phosphohydrolase [Candidatus Hydrogenedens sp.]|nr:HD domain-containing phosphohydrolase [Candidatus Hydrogenedens sp.]